MKLKRLLGGLLNKYRNMSAPVKASMWFLICSFFQKAIHMITTPIFTRILSPDQYGVYSVFHSWQSVLVTITGVNFAAGVYTRGLVKYEEDRDRFSSSVLGLSMVFNTACFIIYFIFRDFFNSIMEMNTGLMCLMFLNLFLLTTHHMWTNLKRVDYDYKPLVAVTLFIAVISPIIGVSVVVLSPEEIKVEARIVATICENLLIFGWMYIMFFRKGKTFYHKEYWKFAFFFHLPLIPHHLSQVILNQSDRIMISSICGSDKAGLYSVAYSLAFVMNVFNQAITSTMTPWIYRNIKVNKFKEIEKVSYWLLILMAVVNLALIMVGPEVIAIMAPPEYSAAVWVIPPVAGSVFFIFTYNLFSSFEFYYEKTNYVMYGSLVGAVLNIVLNVVFLNMFKSYENGFIAAGYTTLFCYIFYSLGHYYFMRRLNKKYIEGGKRVYNPTILIGICVAFLIVSAIATILYPFPVIRFILIAVIFAVAIIKRNAIIKLFKEMKKKD